MTVLILRALGLGDLLTAFPALRALADAFPRHRRVLAMPRALAPLALRSGAVDDVIDAAPLAPISWDSRSAIDVGVNLHGRGPQSHRVLQASRPARLIAFGCAAAGQAGPQWRPGEHEQAAGRKRVPAARDESGGVGEMLEKLEGDDRLRAAGHPVQGTVLDGAPLAPCLAHRRSYEVDCGRAQAQGRRASCRCDRSWRRRRGAGAGSQGRRSRTLPRVARSARGASAARPCGHRGDPADRPNLTQVGDGFSRRTNIDSTNDVFSEACALRDASLLANALRRFFEGCKDT